MYLEQKSRVNSSKKDLLLQSNINITRAIVLLPTTPFWNHAIRALFLILNHTYMSINAMDKVSFLPNQSAIAPRARDPAITPNMVTLIVIGGIQCRSQTRFHSDT